MEIRRSSKQTGFMALNAAILSGFAAWNLYDGVTLDSMGFLIFGGALALWAGFVLYNLVRRKFFVQIRPDGLLVRGVFGEQTVPYDQMTWARISPTFRMVTIAYRPAGADNDRYACLTGKVLGVDGIETLRGAVFNARPDLPDNQPDTGQDPKGAPE